MARRNYFMGEHPRSLDGKGRVILPPRHRDQLAGGAVMVRALDRCVAIYPAEDFDRVADKLRALRERGSVEREAARSLFAGAVEFAPDSQGRVMVPPHLREYAGLERDVVVAGNDDHVEIWDAVTYREHALAGQAAMAEGSGIHDFA